MFKYKLSRKEKKLAVITASLALIAIVFDFAIEPFWKNYHNLSKEINSKLLSLKQNQKLLDAYNRLEKEEALYSRYFAPVKPESAVNEVLKEVETVSQQNSCRIINIKPFDLRDMGSYQEVVVDVALEATVKDFSAFLYQIENLTNPLRIKNFSLSSRSDTRGKLRLNYGLKR